MYEIMEQKEVLHEAFAEQIATLDRLLMSRRISNELVAMKAEAVHIMNHILGTECRTMEDIYILRGKYLFLKNCIDRIDRIET